LALVLLLPEQLKQASNGLALGRLFEERKKVVELLFVSFMYLQKAKSQ